jgi:DNA-binding Lrp family transcriptional regulator
MTGELSRRQSKSRDGAFMYELQYGYELSPKLSEQILYTAKTYLLNSDLPLREGQIEVTLVEWEEVAGKAVESLCKKRVRLTVDSGLEDIKLQEEFGRRYLRQSRIQRLCEEALEQGGILSQEDLARHLGCSIRTIKRDIKEIKARGIEVITRGVLHNIGRGQTHKVKIINLYLEGNSYSEIRRKTHHSTGSIKRYLEGFIKVLLAQRRKIYQSRAISQVTGLSEYLVVQYQQVIREAKKDKIKRSGLEEIIGQQLDNTALKKRSGPSGSVAAVGKGDIQW